MFKKLNKKGFTLAELLVVVAIIGVLVAISIPIFTGQLKKARLATNQANARAAYACATTQYMLDFADEAAPAAGVSYTYTVSSGTAAKDDTLKASAMGTGLTTDISSWAPGSEISNKKLGDATAKTWTVVLNTEGTVTGYAATY